MPFFIIPLLLEIALVVHIVKTGRNTTWIWIIVLVPLAGAIAYLLVEVLPDLAGSRTGRTVQRNFHGVVNPHRDLKAAARDLSVSATVENTIRLAAEMLKKGMYEDARQLYQGALKGIYESDPHIMEGLAQAEFGLQNYSSVKQVLDELIEKNPDHKSQEAHLLYARTLEELNDFEGASREYEVLDRYYSGPEATYRYAVLLKSRGELDKSRDLLEKILHKAKHSGRHYNSLHKEWITLARREYAG